MVKESLQEKLIIPHSQQAVFIIIKTNYKKHSFYYSYNEHCVLKKIKNVCTLCTLLSGYNILKFKILMSNHMIAAIAKTSSCQTFGMNGYKLLIILLVLKLSHFFTHR